MHPRRRMSGLAAAALAATTLTTFCAPAGAQGSSLGRMGDYIRLAEADTTGSVLPNRWFVEVAGASVAQGASTTQVSRSQDAVVRAAARAGVRMRPSHRYSRTFNGMAVTMTTAQATTLARVPGVVGIYPVVAVDTPDLPGSKPLDATADALSGAAIVRDDLGYTGKGIKVGIIDSGVDIDHPDLGGSGTNGTTAFPTPRVAYGYDFVGDAYDSRAEGALPVPDAVPDDCGGHGTHVAGIIGADGDTSADGVEGVAPGVTLGAYRVFGCHGSTSADIILAALDRAAADGMDVINLSLGAGLNTWPDYPTAKATDALAKKGTIVLAAAGNDGSKGVFGGGAPSVGHRTISVASYNNTAITTNSFTIGADGHQVGYDPATGAPQPPTSGTMELVAAGAAGTPAGQGCVAPAARYAPNTAVLIQRGGCTFRQKALIAQAAGAAAVILYNNDGGTISPTVEGDPAITIPVVMTSQADGAELVRRLAAGEHTITWTNRTVRTPDAAGGRVSDFSSYGLGADLELKPDIGAPGGNIWSTYPLEKGGHTSMSGTSMATPHAAGAVALMLQARPQLKGHPQRVLTLLQNTAVHDAAWSLDPTKGLAEPVVRQGAGLIRVDRALATSQTVSPSKISLGEDESNAHTTTLTFTNTTPRPVVYTLANQTSIGTLGTSNPEFDLLDANVQMPGTIVVPARRSKQVTVTITAPADAPNGYLYGGWITATSPTATTLSVPYAGMAGDYQRVSVLTAPGFDGPCLGTVVVDADENVQATCDEQQTGRTYTMADGDQPAAVFRVEYPAEQLRIDVHRANADGTRGELLGHAYEAAHEGRQPGNTGFTWDGSYSTLGGHSYRARAAAGSYLLEVAALRPMGQASEGADWERWTSPAFTITSPTGDVRPTDATNTLGGGVVVAGR